MKNASALLLLIISVFYSAHVGYVSAQPRFLEGTVNNTFNTVVRDVIKPRDPIHIKRVETNFDGNHILAENVTVEGFSNAYLSNIKLSGIFSPQLTAVLEIPRVTSNVYHLKVELDDGDVAEGSASALLEGLTIYISAKINVLRLKVTQLSVHPSLDRGEVTVTGIDDEETLQRVTDLLNYFLYYTITSNEKLHDEIASIIQQLINNR